MITKKINWLKPPAAKQHGYCSQSFILPCMCILCACVCACMHVCVRMRACLHVWVCVHACMLRACVFVWLVWVCLSSYGSMGLSVDFVGAVVGWCVLNETFYYCTLCKALRAPMRQECSINTHYHHICYICIHVAVPCTAVLSVTM